MIKPFKFFSGEKSIFDLYGREINPNNYRTISITGNLRFLKEYHRRLDCIYMSHYNMFNDRHPLYNQSLELYDRTVGFIEGGQLTNHEEIRRYVHSTYMDLVRGVFDPYEIGYERNNEIIMDTYNYINPRR